MPEGATPGTVPTDLEQATGLERLEILGKMQGIDIFDMKPLPSDRMGTVEDPVMIQSFGEEQYCGCTGIPADSHHVKWLTVCLCCLLGSLFKFLGTIADGNRSPVTALSDVVSSVVAATGWNILDPNMCTVSQ